MSIRWKSASRPRRTAARPLRRPFPWRGAGSFRPRGGPALLALPARRPGIRSPASLPRPRRPPRGRGQSSSDRPSPYCRSPMRPATSRTTRSHCASARTPPTISANMDGYALSDARAARRRAAPTRSRPRGDYHNHYVVTAEVNWGRIPQRATFHVDDAHSGARIWSQTLTPVLEDPKSGATGGRNRRARGMADAKQRSWAPSKREGEGQEDGEQTTYDSSYLGFWGLVPIRRRRLRDCLEVRGANENPRTPTFGWRLANVVHASADLGLGIASLRKPVIEKRGSSGGPAIAGGRSRRGSRASRRYRANNARAWVSTPSANWTASGYEVEKAGGAQSLRPRHFGLVLE